MLQGIKWVNMHELTEILSGKKIKPVKTKNGVVLHDKSGDGFSDAEAIKIAEHFNLCYNGKCIR